VKEEVMSLTLVTPPSAEPVTLAEAKAHLKVTSVDEDTLIASLITAARARAEWHTARALITQGWTLWLDAWPHDGIVEIPLPPLQSVTSVTVHAPDDTPRLLDPATYQVDLASAPARLVLRPNISPPTDLRAVGAVEIAFTAGYGDASAVPQAIKEAILELVADLYTHRGDEYGIAGLEAQALLAPYRVFRL
jgi:uncharacterized phiE125 gp8 family phage protein